MFFNLDTYDQNNINVREILYSVRSLSYHILVTNTYLGTEKINTKYRVGIPSCAGLRLEEVKCLDSSTSFNWKDSFLFSLRYFCNFSFNWSCQQLTRTTVNKDISNEYCINLQIKQQEDKEQAT